MTLRYNLRLALPPSGDCVQPFLTFERGADTTPVCFLSGDDWTPVPLRVVEGTIEVPLNEAAWKVRLHKVPHRDLMSEIIEGAVASHSAEVEKLVRKAEDAYLFLYETEPVAVTLLVWTAFHISQQFDDERIGFDVFSHIGVAASGQVPQECDNLVPAGVFLPPYQGPNLYEAEDAMSLTLERMCGLRTHNQIRSFSVEASPGVSLKG